MNLILWRHAEAEDGTNDMQRQLTARGRKQAEAAAKWLRKHMPDHARLLVSPAVRTRQTAEALQDEYTVVPDIAPGASAEAVLEAAGWAEGDGTVLVVGHQPTLGRAAALALAGSSMPWTVRKGGLWWLARRERDEDEQVIVRAVINPEFL